MSLEGRFAIAVALVLALGIGLGAGFSRLVGELPLALLCASALGLPLSLWLLHRFLRPLRRFLQALTDAVSGLRSGDYSLSLVDRRSDELGRLARAYNEVGEVLRRERQNLYQRELMLDTVIQSSPQALVLSDERGRILYGNSAARRLLEQGRPLEGHALERLLDQAPESLREALRSERDGLFPISIPGQEPEVLHVSRTRFRLNSRDHVLLLARPLTREINRQELESWKKLIRVISHELNNSLAPISSLAHSGRQVAREPALQHRLDEIFEVIESRAQRLKRFLEDYARFAKLPRPQREVLDWDRLLERLAHLQRFRREGRTPRRRWWLDPGQIEQLLINLLKNAHEAGGDPEAVTLFLAEEGEALVVEVRDRGPGMSETVLASALLPFYSTKTGGTGLGLALAREIAEAHGGRLGLANREGGGLAVRLWLPALPPPAAATATANPAASA
ncbi:MAG TPA: ATP-binding protein [Nevskiaceae bacterium]|nr:ATP-binding protein [Nevskiaceae bacterium]